MKHVNFFIDIEKYSRLKEIAFRKDLKISYILRNLIDKYLEGKISLEA